MTHHPSAADISVLKAQIAACVKGAAELRKLCATYGREIVHAYMRHVQDNAAECVRRVIDRLSDGSFAVEMDNGAVICVAISVTRAGAQPSMATRDEVERFRAQKERP